MYDWNRLAETLSSNFSIFHDECLCLYFAASTPPEHITSPLSSYHYLTGVLRTAINSIDAPINNTSVTLDLIWEKERKRFGRRLLKPWDPIL